MIEENNEEKLWMASLDGELSASESAAFESSLSEWAAKRLHGEVRLEAAIGNVLQQGENCPEEVWANIVARLESKAEIPAPSRRISTPVALALMAASVAIMAGGYWSVIRYSDGPWHDGGSEHTLEIAGERSVMSIEEADVETFATHATTEASLFSVQDFLAKHDIGLHLMDFQERNPNSHHRVKVLGACKGVCPRGTLVEIMYSCCDVPAKLVIAPAHSSGERLMEKALDKGEIKELVTVGDFVVGVISSHDAHELVDLVKPVTSNVV